MKIIKIVIDILLFLNTILLSKLEFFGPSWHEVLGISMAVLVLLHLVLNRKWIVAIIKNFKDTNRKTKALFVVDTFTMLIYFCTILLGVLISNDIFKLQTSGDYRLVITHLIFGRLAMIIMFIHLGMHLDRAFIKIKNRAVKILLYLIYIIIAVLISANALYLLYNSYEWATIFG